jgi:hypothetical protein
MTLEIVLLTWHFQNLKDFGKRSFKYNGAIHWNNLPIEAKNANSINTFKRILKSQRVEADSP